MKRILVVALIILASAGCSAHGLKLKVRYDNIGGLTQGDRVVFEGNHIGAVTGVVYRAEGDYLVDVAVKEDFVHAVTENSKFFVTKDPVLPGKKALEIVQTPRGGQPLKAGATVEGSTQTEAVLGEIAEDFGKSLEDMKTHFERFCKDLGALPESEEFKKLEEELARLAEEIKRSGDLAREKIEKEFLPRLKEEIEKLRKELQKERRDDSSDPSEDETAQPKEL